MIVIIKERYKHRCIKFINKINKEREREKEREKVREHAFVMLKSVNSIH